MQYMGDRGEFEIIRHDGKYKVAMSLMGQKKHGPKIRRIDGVGRRAAIDQKSGKTSARGAHSHYCRRRRGGGVR